VKPPSTLPELEGKTLLDHFFEHDTYAAAFLLFAAVAAIVLANSPLRESYAAFWEMKAGFRAGGFEFAQTLQHWVNDGLMAIFFFMAGLEIKRELIAGELSTFRRAALPMLAAIGGMAFPALMYLAFTGGTDLQRGWGIPMATDIAFAVGCMSLLGKRVPPGLVVFLIALAIVDDLGAVLVIAVFYTQRIDIEPLLLGGTLILVSAGLSRFGVRRTFPYVVLGILVWLAFLESGVHATIAGVLLAFTIPSNARYQTWHFQGRIRTLVDRFDLENARASSHPYMVNERQQNLVHSIIEECRHVEAPLQRIERSLHHVVLFGIMPIFAFANAGVSFEWSQAWHLLTQPVFLGVLAGLVLGKQIGIMAFSWVAVRLGIAALPEGVRWKHVYGMSWLAGIGFTMSLFIAKLAFPAEGFNGAEASALHLAESKLGILLASAIAGTAGYLILRCGCAKGKTRSASH